MGCIGCSCFTMQRPRNQGGEDCFPGDAIVETPVGPKLMAELRVGDRVQAADSSGRTFFDEVYFFGHADEAKSAVYMDLKITRYHSPLQLSQGHFLPTCPVHGRACHWKKHIYMYARDVRIGDYVWVSNAGHIELDVVQNVSTTLRKGLYNPYTLSGKIVVNGFLAG